MLHARNIRQYQTVAVQSVTPERMIVMLYEGMDRFLDRTLQALLDGDIAERALNVGKVQAILNELEAALDHEAGASFTRDLSALYRFCHRELTELSIDRDPVHIDHVKRTLRPLLAAWREVPLLANRPEHRRGPAMDSVPAEDIGNVGMDRASSRPAPEAAPSETADERRTNLCVAV
ncbi:MAG TPA: flagellar export chaperone FliS [Candidatus Krumholzibacteria bacterium]|nr:flagellar export chaperone FliS [Candidatus Krumholzibacteria bacterium]